MNSLCAWSYLPFVWEHNSPQTISFNSKSCFTYIWKYDNLAVSTTAQNIIWLILKRCQPTVPTHELSFFMIEVIPLFCMIAQFPVHFISFNFEATFIALCQLWFLLKLLRETVRCLLSTFDQNVFAPVELNEITGIRCRVALLPCTCVYKSNWYAWCAFLHAAVRFFFGVIESIGGSKRML